MDVVLTSPSPLLAESGQDWLTDQCWDTGRAGLANHPVAGWLGVYKVRGKDSEGFMVIAKPRVSPAVVRRAAVDVAQGMCTMVDPSQVAVPDLEFLVRESFPSWRAKEHFTVRIGPWASDMSESDPSAWIRFSPSSALGELKEFKDEPTAWPADLTRHELTLTYGRSFAFAAIADGADDLPDGLVTAVAWVDPAVDLPHGY